MGNPALFWFLASVAGAIRPDPGLHPTHHFVPAPCRVGSAIITELYTRPGEAGDPAIETLSWIRSEIGDQVSGPPLHHPVCHGLERVWRKNAPSENFLDVPVL